MTPLDRIKVRLSLTPDAWHGATSEGIWTRLVHSLAGKAVVEVDNIPFFTKSLSFRDKISVVALDGEVVLEAIVERGGHSTYRVFIRSQGEINLQRLHGLKRLGCDWERSEFNRGDLYAVDVPPTTDIYEIYDLLQKGQTDGIWLFEEGYIGHRLKGDPIQIAS